MLRRYASTQPRVLARSLLRVVFAASLGCGSGARSTSSLAAGAADANFVDSSGGGGDANTASANCPSAAPGQFVAMSQIGAATARLGPHLLWTGTEMLVYDACGATGDALYSPCTDRWRPASWSLTACWQENIEAGFRVYLRNTNTTRFAELDGISAQSTDLNASGMPLAALPSVAPTDSGLIVWGGGTPVNSGTDGYVGSNAGAVYDRSSNAWRSTSTTGAPSARVAPAAWSGSEFAVWGGYSASSVQTASGRVDCLGYTQSSPRPGCALFQDGAIYDPAGDRWTPIAATGAVPGPRIEHLLAWVNGKLLVWGGHRLGAPSATTLDFTRDGAFYDPTTQAWTAVAALPGAATDGASFWTGSRLVLVQPGALAGWTYDPAASTWTSLGTGNALGYCNPPVLNKGALVGTCASVDGSSMIAVVLRDGDTQWSQFKVPGPLLENAGVLWNGARLFVWGGAPPVTAGCGGQSVGCDPTPPMPVNTGSVLAPF